jgi:branched-chain amino acid transport system substrate-binding protein
MGLKERFKASGMDLIYDDYYPGDTVDFSPYITKIKYLNPDLLFAGANNPGNGIALIKQIKELGGLGNAKIYFSTSLPTSFTQRPEAVGIYIAGMWIPESGDPGMQAFGDAFMQKYGKQPDSQTAIGYNVFWTAIKAIELAGTDEPEKVAQSLRSGNLEWDSAFGHLRIDSNGGGVIKYPLAQVQEGGKLVKVWP